MNTKSSNTIIFVCVVLLFGVFIPGHALVGQSVIFDQLTQADGLINASVSSILQDDYGFLWFGTQAGLQRYDGRRMLLFTNQPFADNQLSHHLVQTMHYAGGDTIWVGTYGGLNRLDTASSEIQLYAREPRNPRSLSDNVVTALETDANGTLWIATLDGLNRLDDEHRGVVTRFMADPEDPSAIPHRTVRSLHRSSDGTLWIGSLGGLSRVVDDGTDGVRFETRSEDLLSPSVMTIDEDAGGNLWVGSWDGGVQRIRPDGSIDRSYRFPDNRVYQILVTSEGLVLVATWGGGLVIVDPATDTFTVHRASDEDPYSLAHDVVYSLFEDHAGIVWIGTNGNGISKLDPQRRTFRFVHPHLPEGSRLPAGKVSALELDSDTGRLFIGVQQRGLYVRDPDTTELTALRHDPANSATLSGDHIYQIIGHDGQLILATHGGLDRLDPDTLEVERLWGELFPEADPAPIVYCLLYTSDGSLWVGTYDSGVYRRMPGGSVVRYEANEDDPDSLTDNLIYMMHEDSHGTVWIGTNAGLNRYIPDSDAFRQYVYDPENPHGISDRGLVHAFEDSDGRLWFATRSGGIMRYDRENDRFMHVTMAEGLSSNMVRAVTEGERGVLVVSTMNGISRFEVDSGTVEVIDERDGLDTREFSSGAVRLPDGDTLFGAFQEVVRIPATFQAGGGRPPLVQITGIAVLNIPFETDRAPHRTEHLTLDYTQNMISLDFAALDFTNPERNCFQYRLLGLSEEWIPCAGTQRATFTNLSPGQYVFEVTGRNARGVASTDPARLRISIIPPFWQTQWFYAITSSLLVAVVVLVLCLREQSHKRRAKHLQDLVRERTEELSFAVAALQASHATKDRFFSILSHDLRGPVNGMNRLMERIVGHPEEFSNDDLSEIHEALLQTSRGLGSMLENLLEWSRLQRDKISIDNQHIPVPDLVRSVIAAYQVAAHAKNIEVVMRCPDGLQVYSDVHRTRTIVENLLNNAIKFTPQGGSIEVACTAATDGDQARTLIEVRDSGEGIPAEHLKRIFMIDEVYRTEGTAGEKGSGLGLILCRELAERLGGRVWLESEEGRGTRAYLELPAAPGDTAPART